jgi:type IV pilus assembly protein PilB
MAIPFSPSPSGPASGRHANLGKILMEVGVISQDQLNQALASADGSEKDLGKWLIDLGFTTEEKIMKGIGIKAKVPYFTSLEGLFTAESANIISEELARRLQVVPLFKIDNVVTVAMVNPLDIFIIDTLSKTTGYRIDPVVCMRSTIFETINKLYGGWESAEIPKDIPREMPRDIPLELPHRNPPPASPEAGKIAVTNGVETLYIDPADEAEAATDGFRRVG